MGCYQFATPISHSGETPGNDVSADLPAGQRWGSPPLLLPASHPEVGTVWAGDKSLLREGLKKVYNPPSLNHQRAAPPQKIAFPGPETRPGQGPNTILLPARASRSRFPLAKNQRRAAWRLALSKDPSFRPAGAADWAVGGSGSRFSGGGGRGGPFPEAGWLAFENHQGLWSDKFIRKNFLNRGCSRQPRPVCGCSQSPEELGRGERRGG